MYCFVNFIFKLAAHISRSALHPEDHPSNQSNGDKGESSGKYLFTMWPQFVRGKTQNCSKAQAQQEGQDYADPEGFAQMVSVGLYKVGHQDAHDERGF